MIGTPRIDGVDGVPVEHRGHAKEAAIARKADQALRTERVDAIRFDVVHAQDARPAGIAECDEGRVLRHLQRSHVLHRHVGALAPRLAVVGRDVDTGGPKVASAADADPRARRDVDRLAHVIERVAAADGHVRDGADGVHPERRKARVAADRAEGRDHIRLPRHLVRSAEREALRAVPVRPRRAGVGRAEDAVVLRREVERRVDRAVALRDVRAGEIGHLQRIHRARAGRRARPGPASVRTAKKAAVGAEVEHASVGTEGQTAAIGVGAGRVGPVRRTDRADRRHARSHDVPERSARARENVRRAARAATHLHHRPARPSARQRDVGPAAGRHLVQQQVIVVLHDEELIAIDGREVDHLRIDVGKAVRGADLPPRRRIRIAAIDATAAERHDLARGQRLHSGAATRQRRIARHRRPSRAAVAARRNADGRAGVNAAAVVGRDAQAHGIDPQVGCGGGAVRSALPGVAVVAEPEAASVLRLVVARHGRHETRAVVRPDHVRHEDFIEPIDVRPVAAVVVGLPEAAELRRDHDAPRVDRIHGDGVDPPAGLVGMRQSRRELGDRLREEREGKCEEEQSGDGCGAAHGYSPLFRT